MAGGRRGSEITGAVARVCASIVFVAVANAAAPATAADAGWPTLVPEGWESRGAGGGIAILPAVVWWLCLVGWMRSVDWLSRDAWRHGIAPAFWTAVACFPAAAAAVVSWWLPWSLAAIGLVLVAWLVPLVLYARARNPRVPETEHVLTSGHAQRVVAGLLSPFGVEIDTSSDVDVRPDVAIVATGRDAADTSARQELAAAAPGFDVLKQLLQAAVEARAGSLAIECEPGGGIVRHEIDGVWAKPRVRQPARKRKEADTWVESPPPSREQGEAVIAALKTLCGIRPGEATTGEFVLKVDGKPRACRLTLRSGERGQKAVVQIDQPASFKAVGDLGLPADAAQALAQLLAVEHGLILLSSPAGSGLTTTADLVVLAADRLLRDFISLEDAAAPAREIQNVKPVPYDARAGVTPLAALEAALRVYPSAIVARDVRDKELVAQLVELAAADKLVIMSIKANDAVDAAARIAACGVSGELLAKALIGSLSQRLVRRLCPKCAEPFVPSADLLAKLKLTAEQAAGVRKACGNGCRLCGGTGYLGRTGIFELACGPLFRQAIASGGDQQAIRRAAVKDGVRAFRDAGVAKVVDGITSLEEVQRVLTPPAQATAAGGAKR